MKKATLVAYGNAVDDFARQFPNKNLDEITKKDMLNHMQWLRTNLKSRPGVGGDSQHTRRNRLRYLRVFFRHFGIENPLPMKDVKKPVRTRPVRYSIELINQMLKAAGEDEKDLILFFLYTGFRDEETAYATWGNIDLNQASINVYPNPKYSWSPKDSESREQDIVLPEDFITRMKARKKRNAASDSDLIFPTQKGTPNMVSKAEAQRQDSKDEPDTNEIIVEALGEEMKLLAKLHDAAVEVEALKREHSYREKFPSASYATKRT